MINTSKKYEPTQAKPLEQNQPTSANDKNVFEDEDDNLTF